MDRTKPIHTKTPINTPTRLSTLKELCRDTNVPGTPLASLGPNISKEKQKAEEAGHRDECRIEFRRLGEGQAEHPLRVHRANCLLTRVHEHLDHFAEDAKEHGQLVVGRQDRTAGFGGD